MMCMFYPTEVHFFCPIFVGYLKLRRIPWGCAASLAVFPS